MCEDIERFKDGGHRFVFLECSCSEDKKERLVNTTSGVGGYFEDLVFEISEMFEKCVCVDSGHLFVDNDKNEIVVWGESLAYGKGDRKATVEFLQESSFDNF